jgi:hypothetical protein
MSLALSRSAGEGVYRGEETSGCRPQAGNPEPAPDAGLLGLGSLFVLPSRELQSPATAKTGDALPPRGEQVFGGHAVVAVGYDDASQRFIVRNSWGTPGEKGVFHDALWYLTDPSLASDFGRLHRQPATTPAAENQLQKRRPADEAPRTLIPAGDGRAAQDGGSRR